MRAAACCTPDLRFPWLRVLVGVVVAAQTMILGLAINLTPPDTETGRLWLQGGMLAATLVVMALLGGPLVAAAWRELRRRRVTMELLFVVCVAGSFALSVQSLVTGRGPVYFEAVAVLLVVYSAGRAFGARSRARAVEAMRGFTDELATARRAGGESVAVAQLAPGDEVLVRAGELVPVDGRIVRGEAFVRETPFTGEWVSARRGPGDPVVAATACEDGALVVAVSSAGRRVDALAGLVERTLARETPLQRQVDRFVQWFLPVVVGVAAATFLYWQPRAGASDALLNALAVLLVACPCAAGLATPLAVWTVIGRLARRGLVVRDGEAVERLASAGEVVFDKTGTLGDDALVVESIAVRPPARRDEILAVVRAVEEHARHPVAEALRRIDVPACAPDVAVLAVRTLPGRGIAADVRVGGGAREEVRLVRNRAPADGRLHVRLERGGAMAATAALRERLRPTARAAVDGLRALGLPVRVMTGDGAAGVAEGLGPAASGLRPEDKHAALAELDRPLFVGDGLNDAPALAAAHASVALASGAPVSVEASSATLHGGDLTLVPEAVRLARRAVATIRSNLRWAVLYNLAGIAAAATGHLHPVLAAVLMGASSALVSWRSFRLPVSGTADAAGKGGAGAPVLELDVPVPPRTRRIFAGAHAAALVGQVALVGLIANLAVPGFLFALLAAALAAWAVVRVWPRLPAWADMTLGMATAGGLGMNLGWWADLGFAPTPDGACACSAEAGGPLAAAGSYMNLGMLALGVPAMFLLRHTWRRFRFRSWCCGGMLLLGIPGMVAGMLGGSVLAAGFTTTWPVAGRVFADYALMLTGMCAGMTIPHVFELALAPLAPSSVDTVPLRKPT